MDDSEYCPIVDAMQILTKRWTIMLIYQLLNGPMRFNVMECSMGISGRILSERLKEMEALNLVRRHVYPETPVRVEYELTDKGKAIAPIISEIHKWAMVWNDVPRTKCESTLPKSECPSGDK